MSTWEERLQNDTFLIRTGNGDVYEPNWFSPQREKEYNFAEHVFPGVLGSKVDRAQPRGTRFELEFAFQGDDNLDVAKAFWKSADDPRPWQIEHPYYGDRLVQPTSLIQNNAGHNVSRFTAPVIETISDDFPKTDLAPDEQITSEMNAADSFGADFFASQADLTPADDGGLRGVINDVQRNLSGEVVLEQANDLRNAVAGANRAVNQATQDPLQAMRATQELLRLPATFGNNVRRRVSLLKQTFSDLTEQIRTLATRNDKLGYLTAGGTVLSGIARATDGAFATRREALSTVDDMVDVGNNYLTTLDELQDDEFTPDPDYLRRLIAAYDFAVVNALRRVSEERQERVVFVEANTNVVLLAHRFYGPDQTDQNIKRIIELNNLHYRELLEIKKGTPIRYVV